jgi:two-component system cell cycle sensor histidine kinase PleC
MRSAETSGVEAKGFGLPDHRSKRLQALVARLTRPLRNFLGKVSPVTLAVGATALMAAALSMAVDVVRTLDEERSRQSLLAHVAAMAPEPPTAFHTGAGLDGVWQRGAGAFGAAFLLIGLTYRRRNHAADKNQRRVEALLATIPFGVACWTKAGRMVVCNEQYRARLNVDGPECEPGASYHASVKRLVHGGYMQLLSEDDNNRVLELHREDGSCLLIDERPLGAGGFVTLVTDVTERRRTDHLLASIREEQRLLARRYHEEKLRAEAASRSKTSFLAHLSHDIRTPLNHIIGFADLMHQQTYGPLGDARYLSYVEAMKLSGERLLTFFASILELAELESGRKPLRQEPFSIDELLDAVARRFAPQAQRAGLALALGAPCGAELMGDRFSLERMLCNVVENAVRFTPHGGKVTVSAFAATDGVVLEITDTGIGMSEDHVATLSQPFAFGDAAFTREHGGAGLGIAIARAIAELSGGRLAIDSRLALGTTVAISLPLRGVERLEAA